MNHLTKIAVAISIAVGLSACATTPTDPDLARTFVPVQTHQTGDLGLSCQDLRAQITDNEDSVSALDKQIHHDQEQSQLMSVAAAFSGMSGALATNVASARLSNANVILGNAGANLSDQQAMSKSQLRANIEARHEALIGLFYAHSCT
jgi:hypothetical protein